MIRFIGLLVVTILFGCAKEETTQTTQNDIVGKWLRVEEFVTAGTGGTWVQTNDVPPVTVEFTSSGKVISNHTLYSGYTGYRKMGTDSIEITNPGGSSRINKYSFENGKLTILYTCREGCGDRFTRQ
ncbi:MAG: hypothetical protein JWR72_21 [Flavisolibacter sp.]|jgi:hypothetical protein|nr:hypothetical protein [Flavisolibacter sp.]